MFAQESENVFLPEKETFGWSRRRNTNFVTKVSRDGRFELRALANLKQKHQVEDVYLVDNESGHMHRLEIPKDSDQTDAISAFGFFSNSDQVFVLKGLYLLTFDYNCTLPMEQSGYLILKL